MNNNILDQDICHFVNRCTYWNSFKGRHIGITGATGLIGSILVKCLIALNERYGLDMTIYCIVRNTNKAAKMFSSLSTSLVLLQLKDFSDYQKKCACESIDYMIHAAAPTASSYFSQKPVETYEGVVSLTDNILKIAKNIRCESFVYLSSLEVYGEILDDTDYVTEDKQGYVNPLSARSSYSMGKRMSECLCYSYFSEYNMPIKIARLAQTFGAGVASEDNRVFAYIAKSVIKGEDVCLNTPGAAKRDHCYTIDAVDAIFRILLMGKNGEAYNVANEQTYISVRDMAEFVLKMFSPKNHVVIKSGDTSCYPPVTKVRMSTDKLLNLGWVPMYSLKEMYERLIDWYA